MAHITPETVESFKMMFKEQYGVEYSNKEAWEAAHNLLGLFELLLRVDRRLHPENYSRRRNSGKQGRVNMHARSDKMFAR